MKFLGKKMKSFLTLDKAAYRRFENVSGKNGKPPDWKSSRLLVEAY